MSATMPHAIAAPVAAPNRAARLVSQIRGMDRAELVERIKNAHGMTDEQLVQRQKDEQRARAEAAVARLSAR
jgi:hypothetical protein